MIEKTYASSDCSNGKKENPKKTRMVKGFGREGATRRGNSRKKGFNKREDKTR